MGLLVEGKWVDQWYDTESTGGKFVRKDSSFRDWITRDGIINDETRKAYPAERGRYHLYVSLACPWAARVLMVRKLKGLEDIVGLSIVSPLMYDKGWTFGDYPGATEDKSTALSTFMSFTLTQNLTTQEELQCQSYMTPKKKKL